MLILMGVGAAALGVGGERDVLARVGIVVALVWVGAGVLKPSAKLFLLVPVALALLTIAGGWRMGFLVGRSDVGLYGGWSGLTLLMGEELRTASENTVTLLKAVPSTFTYSYGDALGRDLLRGVLPGFLLQPGEDPSTSTWFTRTLFPDVFERGGGVGFTLVGVGYLNFGPAGVAGLFALMGILVAALERFGQKSGMGFVAYVNSVPVLLYSIRADMSVPVSQLLKHVFLPIALVVVLGAVVERVIRARSRAARAVA
jgi:oligosaccharide repeat unit polymerase